MRTMVNRSDRSSSDLPESQISISIGVKAYVWLTGSYQGLSKI